MVFYLYLGSARYFSLFLSLAPNEVCVFKNMTKRVERDNAYNKVRDKGPDW